MSYLLQHDYELQTFCLYPTLWLVESRLYSNTLVLPLTAELLFSSPNTMAKNIGLCTWRIRSSDQFHAIAKISLSIYNVSSIM